MLESNKNFWALFYYKYSVKNNFLIQFLYLFLCY